MENKINFKPNAGKIIKDELIKSLLKQIKQEEKNGNLQVVKELKDTIKSLEDTSNIDMENNSKSLLEFLMLISK